MEILVDVVNPIRGIHNLVTKMKNNEEICPHILQRLTALEKLVLFITRMEPGELSDDVKEAFEKLNKVLLSASELLGRFNDAFKLTQMVKAGDYKSEFDSLNKSLTDGFVTLSGALHVHQEKKLAEQKNRLHEQEKKLAEQDNMLHEQKKKLAKQEKKLIQQDVILQRVESKLMHENRGFNCSLQ